MSEKMLAGKVAVVTGGSRGIGAEAARILAENGACVAVIYAGNVQKAEAVADELTALGTKAAAYQCNVADFAQTKTVFEQIIADFGTVDILVNNAGITRDTLMMSMKEEDFDAVIDVNLKGTFNTIKQVYRLFAKKRGGKIINLCSVAGLMGNPGQVNYSASKAGIAGLTKSVAKELAARGVNCNAIAPGFVKTDMTEKFSEDPAVVSGIPLKRVGTTRDVANLILFLASPLSDYITGDIIRIDGGLAM